MALQVLLLPNREISSSRRLARLFDNCSNIAWYLMLTAFEGQSDASKDAYRAHQEVLHFFCA